MSHTPRGSEKMVVHHIGTTTLQAPENQIDIVKAQATKALAIKGVSDIDTTLVSAPSTQ